MRKVVITNPLNIRLSSFF